MERQKILKLREIINVFAIIIMCGLYTLIIDNSFNIIIFLQIGTLVTCCLYASSAFILFLDKRRKIFNLYKYLSLGALGMGFLTVSNVILLNVNLSMRLIYNSLNRMFYIIFLFEVIIFIISFININKEREFKSICIHVTIATFISQYLIFRSKSYFFKELSLVGVNKTKFIIEIVLVLLYILLLRVIQKEEKNFSNEIFLDFKFYVYSRIMLIIFIIIMPKEYNIIMVLISYFIKFIGNYCIFKIIALEVVRKPNEYLYNELIIKSNMLEKKLDELKRKNEIDEINKQLLVNISHEFKTPINIIYSAVQMQDLKKDCNDINAILKFNSVIKQNCYRLIRLIDNFIDSSKLKQKDYNLELKCLNIVSVVENTTMSILSFAEIGGIEVVFDTEEEELFVLADKDLIERCILNILSNSIKYNKGTKGKINVLIGLRGENIIIEIEDNGIGIPKEKQKHIFNRYERIKSSEGEYKEGSGLGLNIVKQIINKFNGEVRLESEEGIGTKVTLIIPKVDYDEEIYEEYSDEYNLKNNIIQKVNLEMSDICM